eukprot:scaffold8366_cov121-Isochrysis_galbana.AAC.1
MGGTCGRRWELFLAVWVLFLAVWVAHVDAGGNYFWKYGMGGTCGRRWELFLAVWVAHVDAGPRRRRVDRI